MNQVRTGGIIVLIGAQIAVCTLIHKEKPPFVISNY